MEYENPTIGYSIAIKTWGDLEVIGENIAYFQMGITFDMRGWIEVIPVNMSLVGIECE